MNSTSPADALGEAFGFVFCAQAWLPKMLAKTKQATAERLKAAK
jgi:hypothetical protein